MRVYDKEFKEEAIKLSHEIGSKATSEQLGIPVTTLYSWKNQLKQHGSVAFVGSGHKRIDPNTAEIKAMEKRIKELDDVTDSYLRICVYEPDPKPYHSNRIKKVGMGWQCKSCFYNVAIDRLKYFRPVSELDLAYEGPVLKRQKKDDLSC